MWNCSKECFLEQEAGPFKVTSSKHSQMTIGEKQIRNCVDSESAHPAVPMLFYPLHKTANRDRQFKHPTL